MWIPALVFALAFVVSLVRDPRRFRCAVFLLAALMSAALAGLVELLAAATEDIAPYILLAAIFLVIALIVILGIVLILNGFTMVRREGRRPANLLGLAIGAIMLGYTGFAIWAVAVSDEWAFLLILCAGVPLAYLGFGFTAYLVYSAVYLGWTKRWAPRPDVVVVLGAGLIDGQVPPLLACRLDESMAVVRRAAQKGAEPPFVVSGGQGSDEVRSEASAMAEYLAGKGIPPDKVLQEDQSRTTKENIAYTKTLLTTAGIGGTIAVVTNNFHAFRAALILGRAKLKGYAVGSRTAHYFWPAAVIREYLAILRDSLAFSVVCLALSFVPLMALGVGSLWP